MPFPEWAEARFPVEKGDNWSKNIVGDLELLILMTKAGSPFNITSRCFSILPGACKRLNRLN